MLKIPDLIKEFRYSSGIPQFFMYGVWVTICSTVSPISQYAPPLAYVWGFGGVLVMIMTITQDRNLIKYAILFSVLIGLLSGSLFLFYRISQEGFWEILSTPAMMILVLTTWGVYLANLCSRQLWVRRSHLNAS